MQLSCCQVVDVDSCVMLRFFCEREGETLELAAGPEILGVGLVVTWLCYYSFVTLFRTRMTKAKERKSGCRPSQSSSLVFLIFCNDYGQCSLVLILQHRIGMVRYTDRLYFMRCDRFRQHFTSTLANLERWRTSSISDIEVVVRFACLIAARNNSSGSCRLHEPFRQAGRAKRSQRAGIQTGSFHH